MFYLVRLTDRSISSLEVEGLVGGEESHEHWDGLNTDETGLVDVVVSPGSWEVGLHVGGELSTLESLMGGEDLSSGGLGLGFVHDEDTGWGTVLILTFEGVVHDHGSHEEVIGTSGEMFWWDSLVFLVEWAGSVFSSGEPVIISELDSGDGSNGENSSEFHYKFNYYNSRLR